MNTIESSAALRESLGAHLKSIQAMDPLPPHRDLTNALRKKLLRAYGSVCAYCRKSGAVETAHIVPLEIGARTTPDNLVLLCKTCHRLYDLGHMSIADMCKIAHGWRLAQHPTTPRQALGARPPPEPSIGVVPESIRGIAQAINQMSRERRYVKAIRMIGEQLSASNLDLGDRMWLQIKQAELTRRRSARGVVPVALDALSQIDADKLPREYRSVFYYEMTYVHRLLGNHGVAAEYAIQSANTKEANDSAVSGLGYVAAMAMATLCELAESETLTTRQANAFEAKLKKLELIARSYGEYWGGRWALNCAAHRLQVRIKARDGTGAWEALNRLHGMFLRWDVPTGWDAAGRQTLPQLGGLVRVMFPLAADDVQFGIGLLARAFVTRLGPRQRPEGIRDVGIGLAIGLRAGRARQRQLADALDHIMQRTVDGTSVIWPWRAT